MRTPTRCLLALIPLALTAGCLFDEKPPCRIGGDLCPSGFVCVDRACTVPGAADRGPLPDGPLPDGAPPDGQPTDGRAPDGAPADADRDAMPPIDAAPVDADRDSVAPICAAEVCNGLDDDCDGEADEDLMPCGNIPLDTCTWRHRGHHSYLFCDRPVPEAQAVDVCTRQYGLTVAVPDTCNESDWLWATGNLVPAPVDWQADAPPRAWWLGMRLAIPDDGESIVRTDGSDTPLPEGGCWAAGEPDDLVPNESCVNLLYNPMNGGFGWNDESCNPNAGNPVNILCEAPCDPEVDADNDGEKACIDCDDRDPDANSGRGTESCPPPPPDGFPP